MPKLTDILTEMADYVKRSGYDAAVEGDDIVITDAESGEAVFHLEYDEAKAYWAEVVQAAQDIADEGSTMDIDTIVLAHAKPYIDCL